MIEAFRVGPVETHQGTFTLYVACSPAGAVSAIAKDDAAGLAELRKRAPNGSASCEPSLASAGRALGFRPIELPGGLNLTFGERLPHGYQPAAPLRKPRPPRRRKPRAH